jgi:predicted esterase
MEAILRAARRGGVVVAVVLWLPWFAAAEVFTLNNGTILEGSADEISSVAVDPTRGLGETGLKQILLVDDGLRRVFVPRKQIAAIATQPAANREKIPLYQRIPSGGQPIKVVGMPLHIDPFDEWGRRIFKMVGPGGKPIELVQGITEITPRWTKVEAIEGVHHYLWTMKLATSSIPREQLSKILSRVIDPKDPMQRVRIVKLYLQSERYRDARVELEQLVKEFPDVEHLRQQVKELRQLEAQRLVKEIELRRDSGQYRLAVTMLEQFPAEGVAGETLLKVQDMLKDIQGMQDQGKKALKLLGEHTAAIKSDMARDKLKGIVEEINRELNINNVDRMADYVRLADDAKMSPEQKVSLAVSGWLLGSGAAIDNVGIATSLVKVRDLVGQYLVTTRQPERTNILSQLTSEEGATNDFIAKIIAHMKPPVETAILAPLGGDVGNPAAILGLPDENVPKPPEAKKAVDPAKGSGCGSAEDNSALLLKGAPPPAAATKGEPESADEKPAEKAPAAEPAQQTGVPGLLEMSVKTNMPQRPQMKYWVQLPPEYDPYRRYPCIVTLNGAATTPLEQIDWWAGAYHGDAYTRGQATRHGYIVIAPQWTREHQREYEFSFVEHASVLLPLRDACKRFSIDVDRVFITGHSMGGTAAWDMGLAHPDLWAGMIPIVATAGKYISAGQYWENGKYVPMYFVAGEKDTAWYLSGTDWDRYLKPVGYDVMVVQYLGRGHEAFFDEVQNLFTWMNLHKRHFALKEFKVKSLRPWDKFFWWVETDEPKPISVILPAEWGDGPAPAKKPNPAETKVDPLAPNGISVQSRSHGKVTVWLSPELITFNDSLKVVINGNRYLKAQPRIDTLLEDVRTRGDRQHPFWAKIEN